MSRRPIARSPDLQRLQDEGFDLAILSGHLLIRDVPYVTSNKIVSRGILVMPLDLAGEVAVKPASHIAYWIGEHPCHATGMKIASIENSSNRQQIAPGVYVDHTFSAKADYRDYHHKVRTYVGRIAGEAAKIDAGIKAETFPVIANDTGDGVFEYVDTASSRAGITAINARLSGQKVGIVGGGGTGSYVMDLVAKTMVAEIRLIDGDLFLNHNAFRAPGAPSIEELSQKPKKADYLAAIYKRMHRGIVVHDVFIDDTNLNLLDGLDYVFICMDTGDAKRKVVARLNDNGTAFIEVGMGVVITDDKLGGIVRAVCSTPASREVAAAHISYATEDAGLNAYATNIQTPELNALNAALAVIRWKQHMGIYHDTREDTYRGYSIASGEIVAKGFK